MRHVGVGAEVAVSPGEDVEQLLGEILLQQPIQLLGGDHVVVEEHLAQRLAERGGLAEVAVEVLGGDLALGHQVAPQGLVHEVRAAVDRHPVLEEDALRDLLAPDLDLQRAAVGPEREEQGGERHRGPQLALVKP